MAPGSSQNYAKAGKRLFMISKYYLFIILFVISYQTNEVSSTLSFSKRDFRSASGYGSGFRIFEFEATKNRLSSPMKKLYKELNAWPRTKRSTNDTQLDPQKIVTKFELHDSHTTLVVHWGGAGSDVILALAKSADDTDSVLYLSTDYGKNFTDISSRLMYQGKKAMIHRYYTLQGFNNHYVFTDVKTKCLFTTDNSAESFVPHCDLPFVPNSLLLSGAHPRYILGMDENDRFKQLYQSDDFGFTWRLIFSNVKSYYWGVPPYDHPMTIYVEEERGDGKSQIVRYRNQSSEMLLEDVIDFEVKEEYMFATLSKRLLGSSSNPNNQFWVSYKRQPFVKADFPFSGNVTDYYVADASEGQLMVCVYRNDTADLYVSDAQGYRFSLSLERIVYFNPKIMNSNIWLRHFSNETFADITKVSGVEGIYIASQQAGSLLDLEHQITLISYDKGGQWQRIQAPRQGSGNTSIYCDLAHNCSLHLTQEISRMMPGSLATPILTQDSSPGLVIASGTLGSSLKGEPDVFLSTNAGISWHQVLTGNYMYASADHGGIIVAVHQFVPTNELVYSLDEGATWNRYKFVDVSIRVYGLLTEPGENTTIFSVFGSGLFHHSWVILQIDFLKLFKGAKCGPHDYYMWSANDNLPTQDGCLLGRITQYQRRFSSALCYNGNDYVRPVQVRNCSCTSEDYECDYGFEEDTLVFQNSSVSELICRRERSVDPSKLNQVPANCLPGTFYYFSRGYRKVAGDTCEGGEDHRYGPLKYSCPVRESSAFLLVTTYRSVLMVDLGSLEKTSIPLEDAATSPPAIFDYDKNCIIYATLDRAIKVNCLGYSQVTKEVSLLTSPLSYDISSMAFEWTGRNVYLTDGTGDAIRVVNVDGKFELTLYNSSNGVYKPRQIVLDPSHGYLYFVGADSANGQTYSIYRAVMDGSDKMVSAVVNGSVSASSYLTLDLETERLYWLTSRSSIFYSFNLNTLELNSSYDSLSRDISGIGIYKDTVYLVGKFSSFIYVKDKIRHQGYSILGSISSRTYGMVVVSNTSQHVMSACSAYSKPCTQLCMPMPSAGHSSTNRTCLCGDGYRKDSHPKSNDEMCMCEFGEILGKNGTCARATNVTTCASDKVSCRNGHCVMKIWRCDGDDDCGDGTDETDCPFATCPDGAFTCHSGKCIPDHWRCDREDDCKDGLASDEINCNLSCSPHQFQCKNGYCIDRNWLCDLDDDCHDMSDETNCTSTPSCGPNNFVCKSGACVDINFHCNGQKDCNDGSDEEGCSGNSTCNSAYQFTCDNGKCIFASWTCDGDADCTDGSDEKNCNVSSRPTTTSPTPTGCRPPLVNCYNGACISFLYVCNGINDCGDNSDEFGCDESTTPPWYPWTWETSTGTWVAYTCSSQQYRCEGNRTRCIDKNWVCDGDSDCFMGDDERGCSRVRQCGLYEFKCYLDGGCIPMYKRCNQQVECTDGSDETGCENNKNDTVNCDIFNKYKIACCSNPACGVYLPENGTCKSVQEAQTYTKSNKCDGVIKANYSCKAGQFKCSNAQMDCVSWVQVCDNKKDCEGSYLDEVDCDDCMALKSSPFEKEVTNASVEFFSRDLSSVSYATKEGNMPWSSLAWQNVSRSNAQFKVDNLKAATSYYFVLFHESDHTNKQCPFNNLELTTKDGLPSKPMHLDTSVRIESDGQVFAVNVTWSKPQLTNGEILEYIVFYQEVDEKGVIKSDVYSTTQNRGQVTRIIVYNHIEKNKRFDFWVAGRTSAGLGEQSDKSNVYIDPKVATDLKIKIASSDFTRVTVAWEGDANAEGYRASLHLHEEASLPAASVKEYNIDLDKGNLSVTFDGLCPQTEFQFSVKAKYTKYGLGPAWFSPRVRLNGKKPELGPMRVNKTGTTTALVSFSLKVGYAQVYHVYYTHDKTVSAMVQDTAEPSTELRGLLACENYFVWVRPASIYCPVSDLENFITESDLAAAPKNLVARVILGSDDQDSIKLTWKASCHKLETPIGYIIRVKTAEASNDVSIPESSEPVLSYTLAEVVPGMTYNFTVRSSIPGSRESETFSVHIPSRDGPYNLVVNHLDGLVVHLSWSWPQAKSLPDFKEFLVHTKGENFDMVNHTAQFELELTLPHDGSYLFSVEVNGKSGKTLALSMAEEYSFVFAEAKSDEITISKTNLVAILVPVAVVVVALSAGLVFFVVRHKRLQNSFLAFANSHYNIQSGTTTFSDDLDNDEPMIQGFSDDEPLVIA